LDVVVREGSSVLQLLSGEDKSLLIGGDTFLVLNLSLNILDGVTGLNVESDGLSGQSLDENLHTTSKSQHQMESGLLLDVVVGKRSSVLQLLSGEDKSLLIGRNTFLVLNLGLNVLNGVTGLNVQSDGLTGQGLDEDLHTTSESQHQVKGGLLLDVVVGKGSSIFQLLSSENESLLVGRNTFLILDLRLDVLDSVTGLNVQSDGLSGQSLDENLHTTSKSEHQVKGRLLLNVVVGKRSSVLQLLSSKDKSLLIGWDTFFILNLCFNILNCI